MRCPHSGWLTIETKNTHLDAEYARQNDDVEARDYVAVSVSDTGIDIGFLRSRLSDQTFVGPGGASSEFRCVTGRGERRDSRRRT